MNETANYAYPHPASAVCSTLLSSSHLCCRTSHHRLWYTAPLKRNLQLNMHLLFYYY